MPRRNSPTRTPQRRKPVEVTPQLELAWRPCGYCQGQRRVIIDRGHGPLAEICPHCAGVGEVMYPTEVS